MSDDAEDKARALALTPVSRETLARLDRFVGLLGEWRTRLNLISASTVPTIWTRHVADSLQILDLLPKTALIWADLGSGAGFPGLAVACVLAERPGAHVHLVEKSGKKAAFLREAVRATGVPATVHHARIEDFVDSFSGRIDVVTARALAPLQRLLRLAQPLLTRGATAVFLKGQDVESEMALASSSSGNLTMRLIPSRTEPRARILMIEPAQAAGGSRYPDKVQ